MADTNFIGSVTIAANTTVDLFATTGVTAAAGVWQFFSMPIAGGIAQVDTSSAPSGQIQYPIVEGSQHVGAAAFYVANTTSASITFEVRFTATV